MRDLLRRIESNTSANGHDGYHAIERAKRYLAGEPGATLEGVTDRDLRCARGLLDVEIDLGGTRETFLDGPKMRGIDT